MRVLRAGHERHRTKKTYVSLVDCNVASHCTSKLSKKMIQICSNGQKFATVHSSRLEDQMIVLSDSSRAGGASLAGVGALSATLSSSMGSGDGSFFGLLRSNNKATMQQRRS